jgi:D-alanine-D-alanine ligase
VLPIVEIVTIKQDFFDYEEKYESDGSNEVFSDIGSSLKNKLETISTQIYDYLGCRGVVRMDYRYDGVDIYFLEVNTIPGFTSGSLVPKMWKKAGKTEREFVEMLNN